jgi:putative membrane protein
MVLPVAQMWDRGDHMDGWGWGWGVLMMVLIVALIGLVVWAIARMNRPSSGKPTDRAHEILAERFARGEITAQEYQELLQHLG